MRASVSLSVLAIFPPVQKIDSPCPEKKTDETLTKLAQGEINKHGQAA
jgi:hypothetical protein